MKAHAVGKVDKGVLSRLKNGDETAFEYLYWNYNAYVFNFIHSLVYDRELTEDLTQNVFLKLWEKRELLDPDRGFAAYLFTIARNYVYKETENRLRTVAQSLIPGEAFQLPDLLTEETIEADSLEEFVDSLIDRLPSARKEIFLLSRRHHLSNKEIAERLAISEKTVENQITSALRFLREKLGGEYRLVILLWVVAQLSLLLGDC